MASKSENTFGSRIKNAEDVVTIVSTFVNFKPLNIEDNLTDVSKLITEVKSSNQEEASSLQQYSVSTTTRTNLVLKDTDSLKKLMSPIRAYLLAVYGKTDKQYLNINSILNQIIGSKSVKERKNADEKSISIYQQSYASLIQSFSDLIATLSTLSPAYKPTNEAITLEMLKTKHTLIEQTNNAITANFNTLKTARERRNTLYADLKTRIQRIKQTVLSQYSNRSVEYKKIKGFKI